MDIKENKHNNVVLFSIIMFFVQLLSIYAFLKIKITVNTKIINSVVFTMSDFAWHGLIFWGLTALVLICLSAVILIKTIRKLETKPFVSLILIIIVFIANALLFLNLFMLKSDFLSYYETNPILLNGEYYNFDIVNPVVKDITLGLPIMTYAFVGFMSLFTSIMHISGVSKIKQ